MGVGEKAAGAFFAEREIRVGRRGKTVIVLMLAMAFLLVALALRRAGPAMRRSLADNAVKKLPDNIRLARADWLRWNNPAAAELLAGPLRDKGFADLGIFMVQEMPQIRLGVLVNERDRVAAFIQDHPNARAGVSLELNSRYEDGSSTQLVNHPDRGVPVPPFLHVTFAAADASSGDLYERLLRERSTFNIKPVTADTVIADYEAAWSRIMRWEKEHRLTVAEVDKISSSN